MRLLALWIATAGALLAWSEIVFLNEGPVRRFLGPGGWRGLLEMWGFYLLPAAVWIAALRLRWPGHWWQALLAGGLVGWVTEGAMVPAVYEAPPLSFLWTSLAWHAPVDVVLGLWLLPRLLDRPARLTVLLALVGGAMGIWANWTRGTHEEALNLALADYAFLIGLSTVLIALGAFVQAAYGPSARRLPGWCAWAILASAAGLMVLQGIIAPVWLVALMLAAAGTLWVLLRTPDCATEPQVSERAALTGFAAFVVAACGAYALTLAAWPVPDGEFLAFLAFCAGTAIFCYGLVKAFTSH